MFCQCLGSRAADEGIAVGQFRADEIAAGRSR
jgi:hypothetical protein